MDEKTVDCKFLGEVYEFKYHEDLGQYVYTSEERVQIIINQVNNVWVDTVNQGVGRDLKDAMETSS